MKSIECGKFIGKDGRILEISYDEFAFDPRKDYDHVTSICWFHRKYRFETGGYMAKDYGSFKDLKAAIVEIENPEIILPVYMIDHSGISFRLGRNFSDVDPEHWDSGMVGYIWIPRETVEQEEIIDPMKCLEEEFEEYKAYLEGDVYYFTISRKQICPTCGHEEEEQGDSCGGFYGIESLKNYFSQEDLENFFGEK